MRLLTSALVIKRKELLQEAELCCQELANHMIVEKYDCTNWSAFLEWLGQIQPQVLLIDVEHFQNIVEERGRQIKVSSPETMIIALHHAADSQLIIAGMRAGIAEYFYPPLQKNLRDVLERKIDQHVKNQFLTNSDRKTIGFLSAKGGCGGTTIACHVSVELGKRMHQTGTYHVLLADVDVTGGNVRFLMRSKAPQSILDAMRTGQGLGVASWNEMVHNGYPGLEIISGPLDHRLERMPEQREIERVLNFARSRYQWTVLDLGCSLTPYTMNMLENVNELYLVASPDVLALYQVKQILNELQKNEYPTDRVRLILNRSAEYEDKIVAEEAQGMLGIPAYFSLTNDYSGLAEAYASGNLLSARSPLARQLSALASKISGIEDQHKVGSQGESWYRKFRVSRGLVAQHSST
jgi:pilus assembly protein CpaE